MAWAPVGLPIPWGIWIRLSKALILFRSSLVLDT
ncbi:hypothetical protein Y590_22465 [Methylobacterium sp. AMS5]|nr:hypothetical protein Y590_22465 [Methylobacterium sp. AMS5]